MEIAGDLSDITDEQQEELRANLLARFPNALDVTVSLVPASVRLVFHVTMPSVADAELVEEDVEESDAATLQHTWLSALPDTAGAIDVQVRTTPVPSPPPPPPSPLPFGPAPPTEPLHDGSSLLDTVNAQVAGLASSDGSSSDSVYIGIICVLTMGTLGVFAWKRLRRRPTKSTHSSTKASIMTQTETREYGTDPSLVTIMPLPTEVSSPHPVDSPRAVAEDAAERLDMAQRAFDAASGGGVYEQPIPTHPGAARRGTPCVSSHSVTTATSTSVTLPTPSSSAEGVELSLPRSTTRLDSNGQFIRAASDAMLSPSRSMRPAVRTHHRPPVRAGATPVQRSLRVRCRPADMRQEHPRAQPPPGPVAEALQRTSFTDFYAMGQLGLDGEIPSAPLPPPADSCDVVSPGRFDSASSSAGSSTPGFTPRRQVLVDSAESLRRGSLRRPMDFARSRVDPGHPPPLDHGRIAI